MTEALISVRVKCVTFETEQINSYSLQALEGERLPLFTAGSHIDLHLANGMIRSYSLLGDPSGIGGYVIAVKRDAAGRGGSLFIHERLKADDIVSISPPRNNFEFDEDARHSVFLAGGIGITPILTMIKHAAALGRPWELHCVACTRRDAAFLDWLAALGVDAQARIHVTFDQELGGGYSTSPRS